MAPFDVSTLGVRANELFDRILSGQPLDLMGTSLSPKSQDTLYHVGYMQFQQAKYADAMRIFGFLMTMAPMDKRLMMGFGVCLQMQGDHKQALEFYRPASILDLSDPEPVMRLVECHLALGDIDAARTALDYGLAQARAFPEHAPFIDRFETILGFLNNPPGQQSTAPETEHTHVS